MLVLKRKIGESITISNGIQNHDIVVKILKNNGGISIGIQAPAHIKILRSELTSSATIANNNLTNSAF